MLPPLSDKRGLLGEKYILMHKPVQVALEFIEAGNYGLCSSSPDTAAAMLHF